MSKRDRAAWRVLDYNLVKLFFTQSKLNEQYNMFTYGVKKSIFNRLNN